MPKVYILAEYHYDPDYDFESYTPIRVYGDKQMAMEAALVKAKEEWPPESHYAYRNARYFWGTNAPVGDGGDFCCISATAEVHKADGWGGMASDMAIQTSGTLAAVIEMEVIHA